jgi:chaperonin GroES
MGIQPLHDWVLIEPSEANEKTAGGLFIPDAAKEKPVEG